MERSLKCQRRAATKAASQRQKHRWPTKVPRRNNANPYMEVRSIPRRPFDSRPPVPTGPRTNQQIRVPEVRIVDEEGQQVGVMPIADALQPPKTRVSI